MNYLFVRLVNPTLTQHVASHPSCFSIPPPSTLSIYVVHTSRCPYWGRNLDCETYCKCFRYSVPITFVNAGNYRLWALQMLLKWHSWRVLVGFKDLLQLQGEKCICCDKTYEKEELQSSTQIIHWDWDSKRLPCMKIQLKKCIACTAGWHSG